MFGFVCTSLMCGVNILETSGGGPSQEELLEQLQKCDISASRVSSTVSSRAPSPSPSLMSIMYPGLKAGACAPQAGTPTALLRSLGPPANNLFQPIRRNSASGSNLSLSAIANTGSNVTPIQQRSIPLALNIPEERALSRDDPEHGEIMQSSEIEIYETLEEDSDLTNVDNHRSTVLTDGHGGADALDALEKPRLEKVKMSAGLAGLAHQRTRSNEIDYISESGVAKNGASRSSLPSPLGTVGNPRAFRPVSAGSTNTDSVSFSDTFSYALLQSQEDGSSGKTLGVSDSNRVLGSTQRKGSGSIERISSEGQPVAFNRTNTPAKGGNVDA